MLGTAQVVASVVVFEPELAFGCFEAGYLVLVVHVRGVETGAAQYGKTKKKAGKNSKKIS